ncbi:hydroxyacylglutathione hydrolase [Ectothiorhodospiraceae bacterium BW-2]|nr:hydroxyacylglutathione hydrolase [Ectothiorhodospiraceae bacterium BW-2]
MVSVTAVNAFDDNYIWVLSVKEEGAVALVDPGDATPVIELLQRRHWQPCAILITHHHYDHTGGIDDLVSRYSVPVYGPAKEQICNLTHSMREGDVATVPKMGLSLSVIDTPGHTRGHICYHTDGALFCGDTLFTGGCGRIFEGSAPQLYHSLEKLRALPDTTRVYCAHEYTADNLRFAIVAEPDNESLQQRIDTVAKQRQRGEATVPATLAEERATNPFLRCHLPQLKAAAESFCGHELPTPAEVFATVRRWKDSLD